MHKVLFVIALLALMIIAYVGFYLPHNWSRIKLGMSRSQVVELVGEPEFDSGDIKGCFWNYGKPPVVFVLNVFFNSNGKAVYIDVRQLLGPENGARVRHIRWEAQSNT